MFEVTEYRHPYVFVRSQRTAETYQFLVSDDITLEHDNVRSDLGDARRTAIAYLFRLKKEAVPKMLLSA
jgi:hypothetical protein